jgi:E3 ubiquitin-protein ligase TRIP12
MDGQPLAASSTVFQAIQQSTLIANTESYDENGEPEVAGLAGNGRRGRQLWEQVYTLQYRLAGSDPAAAAAGSNTGRAGSATAAGAAAAQNSTRHGSASTAVADVDGDGSQGDSAGDACSQWRLSPLGELLTVQLSQGLAAPQSCLDILKLLQLLEVLNRLAPRLLASQELQLPTGSPAGWTADEGGETVGIAAVQSKAGQMALAHVGRDEFINSKLGNKLAQQLKDVLSICGGGIPAWCHQLVVSCKFLFPFEVRRRYFYSTAFGLGRALQHMHQQQAAEGVGGALERDGRELRIGRLQRQKVRVSRRRILDSAVKVRGAAVICCVLLEDQHSYCLHKEVYCLYVWSCADVCLEGPGGTHPGRRGWGGARCRLLTCLAAWCTCCVAAPPGDGVVQQNPSSAGA